MSQLVINGDCLEKLKELEDNSVDSIVTDPPYELGFMGKVWDNTGIANSKELWSECLRVLKPGGHLLSFGGTRTYHRMACAIEDAGFEIRDMIEWVYGSGFPKSLNIANALAKRDGAKREGAGTQGNTFPIKSEYQEYTLTDNAKKWEGWGTALKPAHEPICLARKPLSEKSVAENVLKYGTGGINIDESRVGTDLMPETMSDGTYKSENRSMSGHNTGRYNTGRFPANLIHDNSEEVRECFPETKSGGAEYDDIRECDSGSASRFFKSIIYTAKASKSERNKGCEGLEEKERINYGGFHSEKGLIENNRNPENRKPTTNNHPTVKPIALMEYLIKMITPPKGIVLDPFAGSGSTLVAAKELGFNFIGIEKEEEYIKIIEARLSAIPDRLL